MWWYLSNWIRIYPCWNLVIVFINPWLDLWFWIRVNPAGNLLIVGWYLWCLIWIHPWLNLSHWVWVNPCWDLRWLNVWFLVIICWSLVIVCWCLVVVCWGLVCSRLLISSWSLIVVIACWGCLLIPFILVLFVTSFFALILNVIKINLK